MHLWPEGLTAEEVDDYTITEILTMKTLEATSKHQEAADMVGTKMTRLDVKVADVKVSEGTDDARENLHQSRSVFLFYLHRSSIIADVGWMAPTAYQANVAWIIDGLIYLVMLINY